MTTATPLPTVPAPEPESVLIRPWPKVVFFYPTFVCATLFFVLSLFSSEGSTTGIAGLGNTWLIVFFLNLLVFAFDFSRYKSITLVAVVIALVMLVLWGDKHWNVTGFLGSVWNAMGDARMNTNFYGMVSIGFGILLGIVWVNTRFHYYEVNAREILLHRGYLGDVKRWSTEGLEMKKEITDLAEFALLQSGRLVFLPQGAREAIVLDNVARVNQVEERVKDLLSVMAVRLNQTSGPG